MTEISRKSEVLISLLVFSIPFNGLPAPIDIGEVSRDGFFYASVVFLTFHLKFLIQGLRVSLNRSGMIRLLSVYLTLILLSFVLNIGEITEGSYGDRTGLSRFTFSAGIVVYFSAFYVCLTGLAHEVGGERLLTALAERFLKLSIFLVIICCIEILSWYIGPIREVVDFYRGLVTIGVHGTTFRLSGVSLEPSFNSFAILFCMPWLIYLYMKRSSTFILTLLVALGALCLISASRTAYVGVGFTAIFGIVAALTRGRLLTPVVGSILVPAIFTVAVLGPLQLVQKLSSSSTVSDVTRSYIAAASINVGLDHPFGVGFGQTSFYVVQTASSIVSYSWELQSFFFGTRYGELPPLFSWYGRSIGEFGVVGLSFLCISWTLVLARLLAAYSFANPAISRAAMLAVIIYGQMLAIAFTTDTVRIPQFWFAWFVSGLVLISLRRGILSRDSQ